jgi:hypothetical protein
MLLGGFLSVWPIHAHFLFLICMNLEEVEEFTYLGSIVNIEGGTEADVENRINKARVIFNILGKVWRRLYCL